MTMSKRNSLQTTHRIIDRLPGFYKARETDSVFYDFIDAIAGIVNEQQNDLLRILNSHWIDFAEGADVDSLAAVVGIVRKREEPDVEYRARIYYTLVDLKNGGTVEAVKTQLAIHLATSKDNIILIENPPTEMEIERKVTSGDSWTLASSSVKDEQARVTISLEEGEAREPTLVDTGTDRKIKFNGTLKKGDKLEIYQGRAKLNGNDATSLLSMESGFNPTKKEQPAGATNEQWPTISRKPSKWIYKEKLSDTLGRFDQSQFDRDVFYEFVPPTTVTISWTARLLASFEVRVPASTLEKTSTTKKDLEILVNAIKAAGIRVFVTIMADNEKDHIVGETEKADSKKITQELVANGATNRP